MKKFLKEESGQGIVEYSLIAVLVGIGLLLSLSKFRNAVKAMYFRYGVAIENVISGS